MISVRTLGAESILWMWGQEPRVQYEGPHGDSTAVEVDPFPGYPHEEATFRSTLETLDAFWPTKFELRAWMLSHEMISRTNGHSDRTFPWSPDSERKPPTHHIVASGKRIPPHPAMTRYLAAHEYGHHVEWWLSATLFPDERYPFGGGGNDHKVLEEYARFRTGDFKQVYGSGGIWHRSLTEIFACDFRLYAGIETEFWPHLGIPRLEECKAAQDWWVQRHSLYTEKVARR